MPLSQSFRAQDACRRWRRALLGLLVWLALPMPGSAEAPRARLVWRRPAQSMCPTAVSVESDVEQLLGRPVFTSSPDAEILIESDIEEDASGARVHIRAHNTDHVELGSRELSAAAGECASLRRPLSLVLSLLLDQESVSVRADRRRTRSLRLGVLAAGLSGTLPRMTAGFGLVLAVPLLARLDLQLGANYWLPVTIATSQGLGASFQAVAGEVALCPRLTSELGRFALSLCGGVQLGALLSSPRELEGPQRQARLSAQLLVELRLFAQLSRQFGLAGGISPVLSLSRPRYYLTHADGSTLDVHRPARGGVLLRVTLFFLLDPS